MRSRLDVAGNRQTAFPPSWSRKACTFVTGFLHAEHNRWWTVRLLAGWKPCEKPMDADRALRKKKEAELKSSYQHWDMDPFDQLDAYTKKLDKVNIIAMAACGYIDCLTGGVA